VTAFAKVFLILIAYHLSLITSTAKDLYGYTKERPLIIVCDWDFLPFEYLSNEGQPAGYNIEVLDLILNKLGIPHKFVMQEWHIATTMFENREADLIHALATNYKGQPYAITKKYINYYNLKTARRFDTPPLQSIKRLGESDTLMMKQNDYAAMCINEIQDRPFTIEYHSPKEALTGIRTGKYKYYIWGEIPLSRKVQELGLDSIVLDEVDIPSGELHIIGYHKELVDIIDDEFTRLEQSGSLDKISDKWFHPERVHDDTSPLALIILAALLLVGIVAFLLSRLITLRVQKAVHKSVDINNMMKTALNMGAYSVVEYDVRNNILRNVYGHMLPTNTMPPPEFTKRMPLEQGKHLHEMNTSLILGQRQKFDMQLRFNEGTDEDPRWKDYYGYGVAETENGKTVSIVYNVKDITREIEEERENQALWNTYKQVFQTNVVAMSFYDRNGNLIDLNQKMIELCEFDEQREHYFRNIRLFDVPTFKGDFDPKSHDIFYHCQHMRLSDIHLDKYIESRIKPVCDEKDQIVYYVISTRDITSEREMYLEQRRHSEEIRKTHEAINEYEEKLCYLLEQSNMFIWNYNSLTDVINYTRTPRQRQFTETADQFFEGIDEEVRGKALSDLRQAIKENKPFFAIHHYNYTPFEPHPVWYAISGIPTFDGQGNLIEYFGIARNITDQMEAQQKLKEETARAEDSGRLKAAFLANMTHEIRTPLNAIVGFSDILQMVEAPEERMEFIRIIRNNCDMLLRLINDILEASSMSQALAIEPTPVEFSQVFNDICQTLEQRVQEAGVLFIKDNPYEHFPAILDKGRIQQVLTNFTTNAVKYTHQGHIKVGYREQDGGIYFYCEDTGAGIPKEKQAAVFERFVKLNDFVQGTGLGLSICKNIAESCGGKIGVTSKGEGHGSTFWLWIPQ
jgi:signal transduction histidine kinase/ABC-type amino acid transport substrate-binding protein